MATWLQFLIAVPCALLIALGMWKASAALARKGLVVRPVDGMDRAMTKIEKQFAGRDDNVSPSDDAPSQT